MILTTLPATNVRTARRGEGGLHPGTASQLTVQAGSNQTAVAGTATPVAPAVLIRDQLGQPVANVPMQFVVVGGSSASEVTMDAFTRANQNPLAGNWTKAGGAATNLQLLNNTIQGVTASGEGLMFYNAVTWPDDQYAECQLLVGTPGGGGPAVRMSAGGENAYVAQVTVGVVGLYKFVGGVFGNLQQVGTTIASTDTIRLEVRGSTLRMYKNGVQLGTDVIDGSLPTGAPGLDLYSNTTFTITRWAAGLPPTTSGTVNPDTTIFSNAAGVAAANFWTLGTVPGVNTLTVTSAGLAGSPVSFSATGTGGGGVATQIALNAGNNQSSVVGTNVALPPSVIVRDASNAPVVGVLVTFAIASGSGSLTGASQMTNASGVATVGSWTLGPTAGTNTLTATSAGLTGSPVTFTATGTTPATFDFYVSPNGGTGAGTSGDPWSLSYAISGAGGALTPGKVVALRGGTYTGTFNGTTNGTAANPITFRQYPGERATISGNMVITGSYLWFWGFEVVSPTPNGSVVNGIQGRGTGCKYIHIVSHDASGTGLTLFDNTDNPDQEAYGCLVYNNGKTNNLDHGLYVDNKSGYRLVRDNIVFNNWAANVHVYGTGDNLHNDTIDGNIVFNAGSISGYAGGPVDILLGGSVVTGGVVTNNAVYRSDTGHNAVDMGQYFGPVNHDLLFSGNYIYGLTEIRDWLAATVTGNTFRANSTSPYSLGATGQNSTRGNLGGHTWSGNTWYGNAALAQWGNGAAGQVPGTAYTYANWLTATGFTNPGTVLSTTVPDKIIVRPSVYEPGRGNIAIFNWSGASNVSVDLSSVLTPGQTYKVVNAQDFYGTPVVSGIYGGGTVSLPMAGIAAPVPIARGVAGPVTGPTFQVFVVTAGAAPPVFYVSTTGSALNGGTIGSPWSLAYAIGGAGGAIQPGCQIILRGGQYRSSIALTFTIAGALGSGIDAADGKIIWRAMAGEHVELICDSASASVQVLQIDAPYNWFWDLDVWREKTDRFNYPGPGSCIWIRAASQSGTKLINCTTHEGSNGVYTDAAIGDVEIHGHIAYHAGTSTDPRGHGFYLHHTRSNASRFAVSECVSFHHQGLGFQVFASAAPEQLDDIDVRGLVCWGGGIISPAPPQTNVLAGGTDSADIPLRGSTFREIYSWSSSLSGPASGAAMRFYNVASTAQSAVLEDSYLLGGSQSARGALHVMPQGAGSTLGVSRNTFIQSHATQIVSTDDTTYGGYTWVTNTHVGQSATLQRWRGGSSNRSFGDWKTFTGLGATDIQQNALPSATFVVARAVNKYESGRGHVAYWNWGQQSYVSASVASFLAPGTPVRVQNVQDLWGSAVTVYTDSAGVVPALVVPANGVLYFPTSGVTPPTPYGVNNATLDAWVNLASRTAPFFDCFLVRQTPVTVSWPNAPSLALISDYPFNDTIPVTQSEVPIPGGSGWKSIYNGNGYVSRALDAGAPLSPSNIVQFRYPIGFPSSIAPGTLFYDFGAVREIYVGLWWKPSNPWQGNDAGRNKICYLATATGKLIALEMFNQSAPYKMGVVTEFPGDNRAIQGTTTVALGQWHRVEWYLKYSSSSSTADGVMKVWLDGVLDINRTDLIMPADAGFGEFQLSPTFGGNGIAKTEEDFFWFDHVYLSGAP